MDFQNKKIVYDTIDFNIALAGQAFSDAKDLRRGTCKGVKIIEFSKINRPGVINVSVQDNDSSELIGRTDYRDYEGGAGSYAESFKPCHFDTKAQIKLDMNAAIAIAGTAFSGQMIFMIEQPCN